MTFPVEGQSQMLVGFKSSVKGVLKVYATSFTYIKVCWQILGITTAYVKKPLIGLQTKLPGGYITQNAT